ncbi:hypothetical protein [Leptospirillum ferriphilum]|jgi:hypothetical protein|uniref:Uncharacterized protein n=2 Tax=Leptospirillum ferriphilum TaxID=178606 RepID=A0A059XTL8_9BACT|nr:hypothetical protein [Leptospirillum ferriphilum]AIA31974.1 hypothetical protein Y981_11345 [Leptospirillum ferriphilum YSK]EAY56667.1 MAG: protein of unknown function [Leptospirillum rubarum]OOH72426.1 hypothetical protein BOX24_06910 [Leptospirillum ferriphilum]
MDEEKVKLNLFGREVMGIPVKVTFSKENWADYTLDDGTTIKLRPIVSDIYRVENEYDMEGNPLYVVKSANMMAVTSPEELKRKK